MEKEPSRGFDRKKPLYPKLIKRVLRWVSDIAPRFSRFHPWIPSGIRSAVAKTLYQGLQREFSNGAVFFLHFDNVEIYPRHMMAAGWIVSEDGLEKIELNIDGISYTSNFEYGLSRPDVGVIYPHYAGSLHSGFFIHGELSPPIRFGEHLFEFKFTGQGGGVAVIKKNIRLVDHYSNYLVRNRQVETRKKETEDNISKNQNKPAISVILFQEDAHWREAGKILESLLDQTPSFFSLTIVSDDRIDIDAKNNVDSILGALRYKSIGIDDLNSVLYQMDNTWLAFMGARCLLMPGCLTEVNKRINRDSGCELIYGDEDRSLLEKGDQHFFKPDFSNELLLSTNYIGELFFIRKGLFEKINGIKRYPFREAFHDLLLRAAENTDRIAHIPQILHSVTGASPMDVVTSREVLEQALIRRNLSGVVHPLKDSEKPAFSVRIARKDRPKISIMILTAYKNAEKNLLSCLESISRKSTYNHYEIVLIDNSRGLLDKSKIESFITVNTPVEILDYPGEFNFSKMNNVAALHARGDYLVLLNDDTEIVTPDWMERMLEISRLPKVGVVGCKLLFPDNTIQHAGVILLPTGPVHPFRFVPTDYPGYNGLITVMRNYSAVTFACALIPKKLYDRLGGLDERMAVEYNDVDFCLRAAELGYRIVWTPFVEHYHKESASRSRTGQVALAGDLETFRGRWKKVLKNGDPFFNPNLTLSCERYCFKPTRPGRRTD